MPVLAVAAGLPALTRAVKLQNRAARVGFDWPDAGAVLDKIAEEIAGMTTPEGKVTADCQFCGAHYEFDPAELGRQSD